MIDNKFEYFLNAVHYCIWLNDIKFGDFIGKVVNMLLSPIPKYLFTKEYRKKYYERLQKEQTKIDKFFYGRETGYHIGWAHHWFGYFYSGYPTIFSFIVTGFLVDDWNWLGKVGQLIIFGVPIGLCYIPAYKAVFTKDRYLQYFAQFEQWHRKWKWITIVFCLGSIAVCVVGFCLTFTIAILLDK